MQNEIHCKTDVSKDSCLAQIKMIGLCMSTTDEVDKVEKIDQILIRMTETLRTEVLDNVTT